MTETVDLHSGRSVRTVPVIETPVPHLLVDSKKEIHGWWPGKRACTSERMLINPYNGCGINCLFCYAKALPGSFRLFAEQGVITVCRDYDRIVGHQLDGLRVAACGYLSPVTDPFQAINRHYRLSEKIIEAFVSRNIPIEFITKEYVSDEVISLLTGQPHSFGQCSILTVDESVRRRLMVAGATTDELFDTLARMAGADIHAVCRIDPIIPGATDAPRALEDVVRRAVESGAGHIVASVMDIPFSMAAKIFKGLAVFGPEIVAEVKSIYTQRIDTAWHADIGYRRRLFEGLRNLCDELGVTFALCMEYDVVDGVPVSMNTEYMSSSNCEGIDIPLYVRRGERFEAAASCDGSCLTCSDAACGIEDLALGRSGWRKPGFRLTDYRRWSRDVINHTRSQTIINM